MGDNRPQAVRSLISEEVRQIIADALGDGMCVSAHASAAQIMRTYPNSGISEAEIVAEIISAASAAGVAVADEPASQGLRHDGDATHFGVLFAQSEEVYATLDEMVSGAEGPIDPGELTDKLAERIPSLEFTKSELEATVRNVATIAAKQVKSSKDAEGMNDTH